MTCFDKTKPKPPWLSREFGGKHGKRRSIWYNHLWNAQPLWADRKKINAIYRRAKALRRAGHDVEVDHIIPLHHPHICGLHVESNLRIIDKGPNQRKSNHYYPGMPFAQRDLFENIIAPDDWELEPQNGF